jgi:hypothetical protein
MGKCLIEFTARNGIIVKAIQIVITSIGFTNIAADTFGATTDLGIKIVFFIRRQGF